MNSMCPFVSAVARSLILPRTTGSSDLAKQAVQKHTNCTKPTRIYIVATHIMSNFGPESLGGIPQLSERRVLEARQRDNHLLLARVRKLSEPCLNREHTRARNLLRALGCARVRLSMARARRTQVHLPHLGPPCQCNRFPSTAAAARSPFRCP